ncbi:MAG: aminotransferase class V-fold PLP-dependent enzyme [Deltaproteobacteria bacterium]|nr:aminotransferase class V-fold PLP-dependent enzyme [Deltaproteobacteria bacterium]
MKFKNPTNSKLYLGPQGNICIPQKPHDYNFHHILPFGNSRILLTHSGRTAIFHALHLLNIRPGDQILFPSYNCGADIDPLFFSGVEVVIYRVTKSAEIDLADIKRRVSKKTRAIYITHYFGFPQGLEGIKEICSQYKLWLIEDCALALFSKQGNDPVGSNGDVSIFSFVKTLPIPDGGALVINNPIIPDPPTLYSPNLGQVYLTFLLLMLFYFLSKLEGTYFVHPIVSFLARFRIALSKRRYLSFNRLEIPKYDYYDDCLTDLSISKISKQMLIEINPSKVVQRRRKNFKFLLEKLAKQESIKLLQSTLPSGVCPVNFPIIIKKRDKLRRKLLNFGIPTIRWWSKYHRSLQWNKYPEACYLKDNILVLPIHQGLNEQHMEFIANSLNISLSQL